VKNAFFGLIVLLLLVSSLQRIHVWKNGLTLFDDIIQKNDHIGIAYGNRAETKSKNGDFVGALADCEHLVALRPDDGQAFYVRGNAFLALHMYRAALRDLTHSIGIGFDKSSAFYNRGLAYYNLGASDSALVDFHSSRSLDPGFADAPYSIGYVTLHSRGDARSAVAYFDSALAINPKYAEALYQKASAEYALRSYGKAMEDLSTAISNHPELRSDPLVAEINRSIDSVNAAISTLKSLQGKASRANEIRMLLHELYTMLGDSLRADAIAASLHPRRGGRSRR
jgi:tetratricopeptide (TPR) repeat protein